MFGISILMCCARNGGSVMGTMLWCVYGLKALSCATKGRKDVSCGEGYGGVVGLGGIWGTVFPSLCRADGHLSMMLCGCVVGQKGWTKGGRAKDG